MIKLRPHHIKFFLIFESKKTFLLSDEEYIEKFRKKNKQYHKEDFILYWKHFLEHLHNNPNLKFQYVKDFDSVCEQCDIKEECKKEAELNKLVSELDEKAFKELNLKENQIYSIKGIISTKQQQFL